MSENANNKIKNEIIINKSEFRKKESATVKLKKRDNIYIPSIILRIRSNFNIIIKKERNKSLNEKELRKISLTKSFDLNQYAKEVYIKKDIDVDKKQKNIIEKKSAKKNIIISSDYYDEIMTDKTIKYKNNKLKSISLNLLLNQIISTDFIEKKENIEFLYNFSHQCFCFIKEENLLIKIINCFNYYKKLNTPFLHLKKLIYFLNLLIIQMYEYHHDMRISLDKNIYIFYKNLEAELLQLSEKKGNKNTKIELKQEEIIPIARKRASFTFQEKIKILEEFKKKNNNIGDMSSGGDKKNIPHERKTMKEKNKKILQEKELSSLTELLNEVLFIKTIIYSKQNIDKIQNIIKDTKNNIKLYKDYFNLKNQQQQQPKLCKSITISTRTSSKTTTIKTIAHKNYYFSIFNYEPYEIGEVLINITKMDLSKIRRSELYKAIFLKKGKENLYPNVTQCITKFNKLTTFIMEDILSYDLPKIRANVIYNWLKVADYLKQRKDHNDCLAIYSALHHYIISGLDLTKKEMKSKAKILLNKIKDYCTFEGNYKIFREEMRICIKNKEFFLPYLGLLLRDISFFESNYDYIIENDIINVEKINKVQNIIDEFFSFKNFDDNEQKINFNNELNFFKDLEIIKEDDLEILANKLEPKFIFNEKQKKGKRITNIDIKYFMNNNRTNGEFSRVMTNFGSFLIA